MGYDPADTDPYIIVRRQMEADTAAAREAAVPGGTASFQVVRKLRGQVEELRNILIRMPFTDGRQVDEAGWTATTPAWVTVAEATIPRPGDKTRAVVSASASVTALAPTTEWGAAAFDVRLVVNGVSSAEMPGTVEAPGVQYQRCSAYPSFVREIAGLGGSVTVLLQVRGFTYDAFPAQNRASLSVTSGFSTV
ncbi:hypothetical protein J2Y69_003348 [Microbacterium resistens]|uniref:Uncharacterized protein n=1 Tax=Microbacterium resistens TaxID=156977 RepID=A0ABU1SGI0_9MICO|nr:hypothetical protein [Microbacterium resistens]MDR6868724.1 hypothetical protein [Microbacterium resistens]